MENPHHDVKEQSLDTLTPNEQEFLTEVVTQKEYGTLNVYDIRTKLIDQLLSYEKESIYEISEIDEEFRDMRKDLDELDNQFKELETIIEKQTNEYLSIIGDLSTFGSQSKIVDTRIANYDKLKDALNMLIGATDFSEEEINAITNPNFEDTAQLSVSLKILTKLGKYIQNSSMFHENEFIVHKNEEFNRYIDTFEMKLKEHVRKLGKKAIKYQSEKENKDELFLVETKFFRKSLAPLKVIYGQLFMIHASEPNYFKTIVGEVGSQIAEFTNSSVAGFEKKYKGTLSTFNIFKKKWNITSEMEINNENLNENQDRSLKLTSFFEQIISNFNDQLESDENFWTKFFSYEEKRLSKESPEIKYFLTSIYTGPKHKLIELLKASKKLSSISKFFVLAEVKKVIEAKNNEEDKKEKDDDEDDDRNRKGTSFSSSTMTEIFFELNSQNNMFAQEQLEFLKGFKPQLSKFEVLLPIRNFTALSITLYQIFAKTNKDIFILNIKQIYEEIMKWLEDVAKQNPKLKDIIMIENTFHVYQNFIKIQEPVYTTIANQAKDSFEKYSILYIKDLFIKAFATFTEYWFKIRDIGNQQDLSNIPLSGTYSKTSFIKNIKVAFSGVSSMIEKIVARMKKELSSDTGLLRQEYDKFSEYFLKEYEEIENFARKAYSERINPSKGEIQAVLHDKRP